MYVVIGGGTLCVYNYFYVYQVLMVYNCVSYTSDHVQMCTGMCVHVCVRTYALDGAGL